jgi:hypothetical protein
MGRRGDRSKELQTAPHPQPFSPKRGEGSRKSNLTYDYDEAFLRAPWFRFDARFRTQRCKRLLGNDLRRIRDLKSGAKAARKRG